jgi:hypothetical protein
MKLDLTAATRTVPLTALMLAPCVSESKYEQQTQQLQVARLCSFSLVCSPYSQCCCA